MRLAALALAALLSTTPAWADDLPQGPKAGPPEPLPEPQCDTAQLDRGDWLLGRWVAPQARWEFVRAGAGIAWTLDQKGSPEAAGWHNGANLAGTVAAISGCTVTLAAGETGAFTFEGVLTEGGRIYGFATNKAGRHIRYVLRRER